MPRPNFVRVKIPETGAHWDCPAAAVEVHGLTPHVLERFAPTTSARPPKHPAKKAPQPAEAEEPTPTEDGESHHGEDPS